MKKFADLSLKNEILQALDDLDFKCPTSIQEKVIPHLIEGEKDLIALAQTGTGKTAAFSLPVIQQIEPFSSEVQVIILCPTRELCIQITRDIENFTKYLKGVSALAVYGGESIGTQLRGLDQKPQIIVGTPGRTLDLVKRKKLHLENVRWVVLDEADEMLNMGFKEELDGILSGTPELKQTLLFSATMPREVASIAKKYMKSPDQITAEKREATGSIEHQYYMVHAKDRYQALRRIADVNPDIYGVVFCRTRRETEEVATWLIRDHYSAEAIHGDLNQNQRDAVMNKFRKKQIQLLVATDVAARGIDVSDLTHVINYNLPEQTETYVHRSGRTGRAGKDGISISIINMKESRKIRYLERITNKPFSQKQIPTGKEICEKQLFHLIDKMKQTRVNEKQLAPYLDKISEKLSDLSREDLIRQLVGTEFNRFLDFYKDATDLNRGVRKGEGGGSSVFEKRRGKVRFSTFQIKTGSTQRLGPKSLITLINKDYRLRKAQIGKIEIGKNDSTFQVEEGYDKVVLDAFRKMKFQGYHLSARLVRPKF